MTAAPPHPETTIVRQKIAEWTEGLFFRSPFGLTIALGDEAVSVQLSRAEASVLAYRLAASVRATPPAPGDSDLAQLPADVALALVTEAAGHA